MRRMLFRGIVLAATLSLAPGFTGLVLAQNAAHDLESMGVPPTYRGVPLYRSGGTVFPMGRYLHDYLKRHGRLSIGELDLEELLWSLQSGIVRDLVDAENLSSTGDQILDALKRRGDSGQQRIEFAAGRVPAEQRIDAVARRLGALFEGSDQAEHRQARMALRTITAPEKGVTVRGLPELWSAVPRAFGRFGGLAVDVDEIRRNLMLHYPFGETLLELRAPEIFWSRGIQGRGIKVGIIDSNFSMEDEEISGAVLHGSSGVWNAHAGDHGNQMARTVRAFAPGAELRLYDAQAMFNPASTAAQADEAILAALERAAEDRVDILLMSFTGPLRLSMFENIVPALARLAANGTLLLTANGNEPADEQEYFSSGQPLPNIFKFALSVGALEPNGRPARTGTRGPIIFPSQNGEMEFFYKPDILAPHALFVCRQDNVSCGTAQGTSFANAVTAGVSALLLSQARAGGLLSMTGSELAPILKETASPIPNVYVADQGRGRLNPDAAFEKINELRARRLMERAVPDSARGLWRRSPSPRLLIPLINRL
ncbi:MAG: S8 family serine peptidase [Elusimicrobia bacterium]|nr:S8 family serine peptidase [Elusimicrobiota bacterium]